jgi:hypothetical protein
MSNQDTGRRRKPRLGLFLRGSLVVVLLAIGMAGVRLAPDDLRSGGGRSGLVEIAQGMVREVLLVGPITTVRLLGR